MSLVIRVILVVSTALISLGHPHNNLDARVEVLQRSLPDTWYHPPDHPVHRLFQRSNPNPPGSPEWMSQYPLTWLPPIPEAPTPQAWLDSLAGAEQMGLIPNISVTTAQPNQSPQYPEGQDPTKPPICSSTYGCRDPSDHWDAPDGFVGIGFDDGPTPASPPLYSFLQEQNLHATHFMIGMNIVSYTQIFAQAFGMGGDIGAHTWTHPLMTTQNNTQVLAQFGWTLQVISDLTGGRIPRYWRPPYGDSDNRVRAIAKYVFNMTQIDWNEDSADWTIAAGRTTLPNVEGNITQWYKGPKSPGLIILEHELTNNTVAGFIDTYPTLLANNWKTQSTIRLFSGPYQNAQNNTDAVSSMDFFVSRSPTAVPAPTSVNNDNEAASPGSSSGTTTVVLKPGATGASGPPSASKNSASARSPCFVALVWASLLSSSILSFWT